MKWVDGFRPDVIFDTFSEMMLYQQKIDNNVERIEFDGVETWTSGKRYAVFWIYYNHDGLEEAFVEVDD